MCLETKDPNTHRKKQNLRRVCDRQSVGLTCILEPQSETLVTSKAKEDQCSVICADFVFGLSRSRFQSPTTVLTVTTTFVLSHEINTSFCHAADSFCVETANNWMSMKLVPTFTKERSFHAQIHDQGRGGVKDVLVTVKKQRADQPLESHFIKTVIRTNNARQKQCHQPPRIRYTLSTTMKSMITLCLAKNFCPLVSTATCRTPQSLRTVEVTISDRPRQLQQVSSHSRRDPKVL